MRIPITMCHGIAAGGERPLTKEHFDGLLTIAADMGFQAINYDDLDVWWNGAGELPDRPIMIDFDHPVKSMRHEINDVMQAHGFKGTLFINTGKLDEMYAAGLPPDAEREFLTWEEAAELVEMGWLIGSHTVTHPNLSELFAEDPDGGKIRAELQQCDATLAEHLGITSRDFAFTGTTWSSGAEREVKKRYRFGRLWIVGSEYNVDGRTMRYADLVGVPGDDEADGGPPHAARYITRDCDRYRLPSMELQRLVHAPDAFRAYLERALETE